MLDVLGRFLRIEGLSLVSEGGEVIASACKRWPARPGAVLASILYRPQPNVEAYRQLVAVIDGASARVLSSWQGNFADEPGVERMTLSIDTARYDLAPGVRAFGVDLHNPYSPSLADGGAGHDRTLFVQSGARLKPVLDRMTMFQWRYVVGPGIEERSASESFPVSLTVANSSSHGYADLRVGAIALDNDGRAVPRKPFVYLLRFDGKQYPTNQMNNAFWTWQ